MTSIPKRQTLDPERWICSCDTLNPGTNLRCWYCYKKHRNPKRRKKG